MKNYKVEKIKNKRNGFTLIELIVVITIIAVVSVVAIVNYGSTSKRSRDGRRMADLEKIRIALELYRQENNGYPADKSDLTTKKYLQGWPSDPTSYRYDYLRTGVYTYTLSAHMEDPGFANMSLFNGCATTGDNCNYQVANP